MMKQFMRLIDRRHYFNKYKYGTCTRRPKKIINNKCCSFQFVLASATSIEVLPLLLGRNKQTFISHRSVRFLSHHKDRELITSWIKSFRPTKCKTYGASHRVQNYVSKSFPPLELCVHHHSSPLSFSYSPDA